MSEITPNTPNPVREDAYVEELAEKLGIDPQYIPKSPVWRNEEEIKAIAEMFANMQGGGSSGGGVLVVNATAYDGTLDKTWQEIHDAALTGIVSIVENGGDQINVDYLREININGSEYQVGTTREVYFIASSADGYPVISV